MIFIWIGFVSLILLMLAIDLGVFHRTSHTVSLKEALKWSLVWVTMGLSFTVFIYYGYESHWLGLGSAIDSVDGTVNNGSTAAVKYLTSYIVEKSLSVDNIFVIAMLFTFFGVPQRYQHRVLFWGVLGALILRGVMIGIGAVLIAEFHWILYLFGAFLVFTGIKMFFIDGGETDPNHNIVVKWARKMFPVTARYHGEHFIVRAGAPASKENDEGVIGPETDEAVARVKPGTLMLTPLALALIVVETTDVIFAVDSIPAIFAITADPFIVFTSNVFAILGLRSLYFALAEILGKFKYLKPALALVLLLVGVKMLAASWLKELLGEYFNFYLLGAVVGILSAGILASIVATSNGKKGGK